MQKKLVYENLSEMENLRNKLAAIEPQVNNAVAMFNGLPLNDIKTVDQLRQLFTDLPGLVLNQLPESETKVFGVPLNRKKLVELLDMDTSPIEQAIDKIYNRNAVFEFVELARHTPKGFAIEQAKLDARIDLYRVYATTTRAVEVHKAFENVISGLNKLIEFGVSENELKGKPLQYWLNFDGQKASLNISRFGELAG